MTWAIRVLAGLAVLLVAATVLEAVLEARDRARFPPPGRMVDIGGGRRLHVRCQGNAPGPTVVIEQGAGSPSILWWPVQSSVAAFARVCTYDRAGYLWSDWAGSGRGLQARVADLHAMLTAADISAPYILVAHSFGGPVARLFAKTYPAEVAGMVLVDTPEEAVILRESYQTYVRQIGYFARGLGAAARLGLVRLAATFLTAVPEGLDADAFRALKAYCVQPAFFRAMADDPPALSRSPEVLRGLGGAGSFGAKPLVVITHGIKFPGPAAVLEDGWLDGQRRLAALSTQGELVTAAHANHMVQSDQPQIVIDAIRNVVGAARSHEGRI
jgi:pimeloyl-ACP methyl ester carboxylesterase